MEGRTITFERQKLICLFTLMLVTLAKTEQERAAVWDDWREKVESLVTRMNPDVRPPAAAGQHVTKVSVAVDVLHLNKLNLDSGVIDLSLWIQTSWQDVRMGHYQSKTTDHIVLAADKVWIPDVTFLNAIGEIEPIHRAIVSYNREGKAVMTQAFEVSLTCPANGTSATQTCLVKLGSWTFDSSEQELLPGKHSLTMREGWTNQRWSLDNSSIDLDPFFMGHPPLKFSRLVVTLTLKRNGDESHCS